MRKLVLTCLAAGLFAAADAQKSETLFTYGGMPVSKEEFLRVYQKNALNKKPDFSDTALRSYLDLYSVFKMKVHEAELQHIDTVPSVSHELDNYRHQLAKTYLTDDKVSSELVHEAYDRSKEEVHVQHIMIACPPTMTPADTLKAYNKADSIYNLLTKSNADFAELAKGTSDDRGSKERGGDIGWMTSMQTLYAIENAVYSTPVGKISKPFRTQFGYHIIKVIDKRPAMGEVKVAQILISVPQSRGEAGKTAGRLRADSVYAQLKAGASFDDMVKKYSEDKFTKDNNGVMQPFGPGRMVPAFENAAFGLKQPGDFTQPVESDYGFHIIKLLEKYPVKPYDSVKDGLKRRVDNDSRAQVARDRFFETIKEKNGWKEYPANYAAIMTRMDEMAKRDTGVKANTFVAADYANMNQPLFALGKGTYSQSDFMNFAEGLTRGRLMGPRPAVMKDIYKMYVDRTVNDYEEHHLAEESVDFRNLMDEYRNGILLFELMDRNVWGKATKDSTGLQSFYSGRSGKYIWDPGFSGAVYRFKDDKALASGMKSLQSNATMKDEELYKAMAAEGYKSDAVNIQHGRYEFTHFTDVPQSSIVKGKATKAVKNGDGSYTVVVADEVYNTAGTKTLDDARGYAVADYQDYLEKQWNAQLRTRYPVVVNEKVFKSMVK